MKKRKTFKAKAIAFALYPADIWAISRLADFYQMARSQIVRMLLQREIVRLGLGDDEAKR